MPEISVVVVTYNADFRKLKMTADSILCQKNADYEIVFADDGSARKWNDEIRALLPRDCAYTFADSPRNVGTVANIYNGLQKARGKYVKVISPGDYFRGENALRQWIDFMDATNADVSFCNAVYYKEAEDGIQVLQRPASPRNTYIYHRTNNRKKLFADYLLANDTVLGASVAAKRDILEEYLSQMCGKVKYAEDYMLRLMVFDGKRICHLEQALIWYEYGEGISTTADSKWGRLLKADFDATNAIIAARQAGDDRLQKKYQRYLKSSTKGVAAKIGKVCAFPTVVLRRLEMKHRFATTAADDARSLDFTNRP